jgi:hypothetical protein
MEKMSLAIFASLLALSSPAAAHHLDDYGPRIRQEAGLPAEWFSCRAQDDCALVSVPCQSGLAVSAAHSDEAQEALNHFYSFCLGSSVDDTVASCQARHCVTEPKSK